MLCFCVVWRYNRRTESFYPAGKKCGWMLCIRGLYRKILCCEPQLLLKQGCSWVSCWVYGMDASAASAWIYFSSCWDQIQSKFPGWSCRSFTAFHRLDGKPPRQLVLCAQGLVPMAAGSPPWLLGVTSPTGKGKMREGMPQGQFHALLQGYNYFSLVGDYCFDSQSKSIKIFCIAFSLNKAIEHFPLNLMKVGWSPWKRTLDI